MKIKKRIIALLAILSMLIPNINLDIAKAAENVEFKSACATDFTNNSATLSVVIDKTPTVVVKEMGVYVGTSSNPNTYSYVESIGEALNSVNNGSRFEIKINVLRDLGVQLSAGRYYYYQFFLKTANDIEYKSDIYKFSTESSPKDVYCSIDIIISSNTDVVGYNVPGGTTEVNTIEGKDGGMILYSDRYAYSNDGELWFYITGRGMWIKPEAYYDAIIYPKKIEINWSEICLNLNETESIKPFVSPIAFSADEVSIEGIGWDPNDFLYISYSENAKNFIISGKNVTNGTKMARITIKNGGKYLYSATFPVVVYDKVKPVKQYQVKYVLDGGVNNSANPTSYTASSRNLALMDASKEGYNFLGWYTDSRFTKAVKEINVMWASDVTLYAKFEKIEEPVVEEPKEEVKPVEEEKPAEEPVVEEKPVKEPEPVVSKPINSKIKSVDTKTAGEVSIKIKKNKKASRYIYEISTSSTFKKGEFMVSGRLTNIKKNIYKVSHLAAGTYYIRVYAVDKNGESSAKASNTKKIVIK